MQLRKCLKCKKYSLRSECDSCKIKTIEPFYRFKQIRDAPKDSSRHFLKQRKD